MERNDLTKLAKLVAKDVAAGQPGDYSLAVDWCRDVVVAPADGVR